MLPTIVVCLSWFHQILAKKIHLWYDTKYIYIVLKPNRISHVTRSLAATVDISVIYYYLVYGSTKRLAKGKPLLWLFWFIHSFTSPWSFSESSWTGVKISSLGHEVRFASRRHWGGQANVSASACFCLEYTPHAQVGSISSRTELWMLQNPRRFTN